MFQPLIADGALCLPEQRKKEREFFTSLSFLAGVYGFTPPKAGDHAYPLNILRALEIAEQQVRQVKPGAELAIIEDADHVATILTSLSIPIGFDLYYIPLEPFHSLWNRRDQRPEALLLASILAYVHQVLQLDSFADDSSYLYYYYYMMSEPEVVDGQDNAQQLMDECREALAGGRKMTRIIRSPSHLQQLERRHKMFRPTSAAASALLGLAARVVEINRLYPGQSIHDHITSAPDREEGDCPEEYESIPSYQYLSFCWKLKGPLSASVLEWVGADHQEASYVDAPLDRQLFDCRHSTITLSLDFEQKVFDLINDLIIYLNHLP